MLTYILILPDQGGLIVDYAQSVIKLDFSEVWGRAYFEVGVRFEERMNAGGPYKVIATVDFTGFPERGNGAYIQVQRELAACINAPGFEDGIRTVNSPILHFSGGCWVL